MFENDKKIDINKTYKNLYCLLDMMEMIYTIPNGKKSIRLFGGEFTPVWIPSEFVERNKDVCKIIYNEKEFPLTQNFDVSNITEEDKKKERN